jgi:SAM-dependent methyltransferase
MITFSKKVIKPFVKKLIFSFLQITLSYPKKVQCNICQWEGRHFLSDSWHKHIKCPKCYSGVRQRLFFATLQYIENLSFDKIIYNKKILHFAPEEIVSSNIQQKASVYTTADFLREDCSLKLDISNMAEVNSESFDIVIAFDVLEHVPDYKKALEEINRVLSSNGWGIFTVPQKDNLLVTFEDPAITTPQERIEHFGVSDHLRIFGDDFTEIVAGKGFSVTSVDELMFSGEIQTKHVLFPPELSKHPLATNFRKVFFCQKNF